MMNWQHISPIPGHGFLADINCDLGAVSPAAFGIRMATSADFDGDGQDELVIVPDVSGGLGTDLWAMKFDRSTRRWVHMSTIPDHPFLADIRCDGGATPSTSLGIKLVVAGHFSGGVRAELVAAPGTAGTAGNDLWVLRAPERQLFWTSFAKQRGLLP